MLHDEKRKKNSLSKLVRHGREQCGGGGKGMITCQEKLRIPQTSWLQCPTCE